MQHHDPPVLQLWLQGEKKLLQELKSRDKNNSDYLKLSSVHDEMQDNMYGYLKQKKIQQENYINWNWADPK